MEINGLSIEMSGVLPREVMPEGPMVSQVSLQAETLSQYREGVQDGEGMIGSVSLADAGYDGTERPPAIPDDARVIGFRL